MTLEELAELVGIKPFRIGDSPLLGLYGEQIVVEWPQYVDGVPHWWVGVSARCFPEPFEGTSYIGEYGATLAEACDRMAARISKAREVS